jgi:AcrR family transcriptional regulator
MRGPSGRVGRGADPATTRRRILAAGTRLYATRGPESVTVRAVSARARVTPPTIYWHFQSMDGLLREIIDEAFLPLLTALTAIDASDTPRNRLLAAVWIYKDFALSHPHAYHAMFIAAEPGRGVLRNERNSVGTQSFAVLQGIVGECIRAGDIVGESPERAALSIWGFAHGHIALQLAGKIGMERSDFDRFFDDALSTLLRGLARK